jgi:hypothetical protein
MIRKFFRKSSNKKQSRFDKFLEKYNLPKAYFATHRRAITRGLAIGALIANVFSMGLVYIESLKIKEEY